MLTNTCAPDGKPLYQCDKCGKEVASQDVVITFSGDYCADCSKEQTQEGSCEQQEKAS